jgi:hypothetical protein
VNGLSWNRGRAIRRLNKARAERRYELAFAGPLWDGTPATDYSERVRKMPCCVIVARLVAEYRAEKGIAA